MPVRLLNRIELNKLSCSDSFLRHMENPQFGRLFRLFKMEELVIWIMFSCDPLEEDILNQSYREILGTSVFVKLL